MNTEKLTNDIDNINPSTSNQEIFLLNNNTFTSTIEMTTIQQTSNQTNTFILNEPPTPYIQSTLTDLSSYSNNNIPHTIYTNKHNSYFPKIPHHLRKYFLLSILFLSTGLFFLALSFILSFISKHPYKYIPLLICSFIISLLGAYFSFKFFYLKHSSQSSLNSPISNI